MGGLFGSSSASSASTSDTPLTGIDIQTSANGLPIPLIYGTTRVTPNLLGYYDFTAVPHSSNSSSGGKGGETGGDDSVSYTYTASFLFALGEGPVNAITKSWINKTQQTPSNLFSIFLGSYTQTPWAYLTTTHPDEAISYPGIVYVAAQAYDLGSSANLPNHNFEVQGKFLVGSGILDANPKDIVTDLLTNPLTGVPNAPALGDVTMFSNYCLASGILLSPCYADQTDAATMLTEIFQLTNTGVFFSEGVLKLVPYGDTALTGNGATYTPNLTPAADLTDDDYLGDNSDDPIKIKRNSIADTGSTTAEAYNQVTLEYLNRGNQYQSETVTVQDMSSIDLYGLKPMSSITAHQIADPGVAGIVADLILQRTVAGRAQYEFKLGWRYYYLEPTDIVTLAETRIGLSNYPVRILSVEEDDEGTLSVLAEEAPPGAASFVQATVPTGAGYSVDYNAAPGRVSAVCIFEPPFKLAAGSGLEVWAGVTGPAGSSVWGGCNVWVSYDGDTYQLLGQINNPARVGHLTAAISKASTGPMGVKLDGQGGQLLSASAVDAEALMTLFYVGGADAEFMAYQGATLTNPNTYSLDTLIRGVYGSAEADHRLGDPFIRLDNALFKSGSLPLDLIGSTIHFKFQSFNVWRSGFEALADLPVYDYVISGQQATGNPVNGLTASAIPGSTFLTELNWTPSPGADHYEIDQSGNGVTWLRAGETTDTTWIGVSLFGSATRFRVAAVRARAGTWSTSAFLNMSSNLMWNSDPSTLMWNSDPSTLMWS